MLDPLTFVIAHTAYVVPSSRSRSVPYYEITFATDNGADAPGLRVMTRDVDLYALALAAEGTPQRFAMQSRIERQPHRPPQHWLEVLAAV